MEISTALHPDGTAEIAVDAPPVNALTADGWHRLAAAVEAAGAAPRTRAVLLRAEGRGFSAGVDIKEVQRGGGAALVEVNRGCAAAFAAVYACPAPVVAAVQGYCLGGGVGLAGSADVVLAAEDAYFALPEVDRGALGAATHLSRLVPGHLARAMVYTCRPATAAQLHAFGSVLEVVPPGRLREAALEVAGDIAAKDPEVVRRAKESLNGIDPVDPRRSYRFEQGFTFELGLNGAGDRLRDAFVGGGAHPDSGEG
ncbi:enoyl-CoA hydratase family protein [Nocardiopsis suaedae]|uniref:Enoyl-CoA hydratase family protein n=1 Tax=Nocardiopsis suaedae TaxID=3018444 RepID=A0ABT4TQE2_9ACTN|nr:enoyl-CoA hydratase family protein [Nocardiopsis suaedae]MDA2806906.1 enoyl-CoA hydratase family protein [Nocardiopsis suaedae]